MQSKRQKQLGFTLLEMLLALAIFAMLGMATYTVLNNTVEGSEIIKQRNVQLTELQRAFTLIEGDFLQLAQRHARFNGEEPSKQLFHAQEYLFDSEGMGFAFVRDGWTNPAMVLPRSEMQPVAYRLKEGILERLYFNFVDADIGAEPRVQPLLTGIETLALNFYDGEEWLESLPEEGLPLLVKLTLQTEAYGEVVRLFPLIQETKVK